MASYLSSLSIAEQIRSPFREAIALESLGRLNVILGKNAEALGNFNRALQIANRIGAKGIEANLLQVIGSGYAGSRNKAESLGYFERAVRTAEASGDDYLLIATLEPIADDFIRLGDVDRARDALIRLRDLDAKLGYDRKSAQVQRKIEQLPGGFETFLNRHRICPIRNRSTRRRRVKGSAAVTTGRAGLAAALLASVCNWNPV
jgi:tetratricopeptide (TPR) repeat protein